MKSDKCANWKGPITGGYGVDDGMTAHRRAWMIRYGDIPDGLLIHHICGNTLCIKVEHLVAVSKAEHGRIHRHKDFRRGDSSRRWRLKEADIREALKQCRGIKRLAAQRLECTRSTLDSYLTDLQIDVKKYRQYKYPDGVPHGKNRRLPAPNDPGV